VVTHLATELGVKDPSTIRLTAHNCYSNSPKPQPIKYRAPERLDEMLVHHNQTSSTLYYEVLDIPLPEMEQMKTLKVTFHNTKTEEVAVHHIRLPKESVVEDVLQELKAKVGEEMSGSGESGELRMLEVFYHKIYKIFGPKEKIDTINDQYWTLRAEEIPKEEMQIGSSERLIHVYHMTRDSTQNTQNTAHTQVQNFGEPFFLKVRDDETLAEVKVRLQTKLQVTDEEFAKWKFSFYAVGRSEYLQDTDIVLSKFGNRRDNYGAWEQYLGLEHIDKAPKRPISQHNRGFNYERPVQIRG